MDTPATWYKTATFWFTLAALMATALLTVKLFPSDSSGEKLLLAANLILGGLGYGTSRMDVKKAWALPSPVEQVEKSDGSK